MDVTLLTGFGGEATFVREILTWYEPRVADPVGFARENRVLLVQAASGVGIDIAPGGMPFEASAVARATPYGFAPGVLLQTASAEDLIVMKAFAARPKDWVDVEGILVRQGRRLDWDSVEAQLQPLVELKEEPEILERLSRMWRMVCRPTAEVGVAVWEAVRSRCTDGPVTGAGRSGRRPTRSAG